MNRKTVALGIAAVAAVAAAVVVTVANGRGTSPEHDATAAYITNVDTIQQQLRVELTKATQTYRAFALGSVAADRPKLEQAQRTIRTLERRLVALPAPAVATPLKLLLVKLAHAEVTLAVELGAVATFSPRFATLLRSVRAARVDLARALGAATPPKAHAIHGTPKQVKAARAQFAVAAAHAAALQADALDSFDAKIARVRVKLQRLRAPALLRPAYRTQLHTLAATRTAGEALAHELRKSDRSRVSAATRRFTSAVRTAASVGSQRAESSAVKAYNSRVRAIGSMQSRIQNELARLQRTTE